MPRPIGSRNGRKKKGSKKIIKSTPKTGKHPAGRGGIVGAVERLDEKILRAHRLKAEGLYLYEVAEIIGREFGCPAPNPATICVWCSKWEDAFFEEIKDIQKKHRQDQFFELQLLKRKWLPIAAIENLQITRTRKEDGETVSYVDENAYDEQIKALNGVLKIHERQARLFGLDMQIEKDETDTRSPKEMFLFISQQFSQQANSDGKPLEMLELRAGSIEADAI